MLKNATLLTKILIGAGAAAVVAAAVIVIVTLTGRQDAFRQIGVYEIDGKAEVERTEAGIMDAYVNMQLQSEDKADTKEKSYMQLKLDEDKYILLDPLTKIELIATGTSTDSKTRIELREGAIVNRIEKPLSEASTYEVNTPNSTMSVRGTIFRVEVWKDKDGLYHTLLSVIEGIVVSELHDVNGNPIGDVREFKAGEEAHMVEGSEESYYVGDPVLPELEEWRVKELEFIGRLFEYNEEAETFVTPEQIDEYIEELLLLGDETPLGASLRYMDSDEDTPVEETVEEQTPEDEEPSDSEPEEETHEDQQTEPTEQGGNADTEAQPVETAGDDVTEDTEPAIEENIDEEAEDDAEEPLTEEDTSTEDNGDGTEGNGESGTEGNGEPGTEGDADTDEGEGASTDAEDADGDGSGDEDTDNNQGSSDPTGGSTGGESGNTGGTTGGTTGNNNNQSNPQTVTVTYYFEGRTNGATGTKVFNYGDVVTVPSIKAAGMTSMTGVNVRWIVVGGTYNGIGLETGNVLATEDMKVSYGDGTLQGQ